jgi:hypothetical protein
VRKDMDADLRKEKILAAQYVLAQVHPLEIIYTYILYKYVVISHILCPVFNIISNFTSQVQREKDNLQGLGQRQGAEIHIRAERPSTPVLDVASVHPGLSTDEEAGEGVDAEMGQTKSAPSAGLYRLSPLLLYIC